MFAIKNVHVPGIVFNTECITFINKPMGVIYYNGYFTGNITLDGKTLDVYIVIMVAVLNRKN